MTWGGYWVQWVVQNVLPPSAWTLAGLGASHWAHRRQAKKHHAELLVRQELNHRELKRHIEAAAVTASPPEGPVLPLNCFACGYSGAPDGHRARHDAYLEALAKGGGERM